MHWRRWRKTGDPGPAAPGPPTLSLEERFWAKIDKRGPDDCWLWTARDNSYGYGVFRIDRHYQMAHRVSWALAHGPIPAGLWVLHTCDNRRCVNVGHLYLGTPGDNARDREARGRGRPQRGTERANAKLTEADVLVIRERYAKGGSASAIARDYPVSRKIIEGVVVGRRWPHVGGPITRRRPPTSQD